jgi:hypothetical protein
LTPGYWNRALPTRTSLAKVSDLTPPKVHPSNIPKDPLAAPTRAPGTPSQFTGEEIAADQRAPLGRWGGQMEEAATARRMRETTPPKGSPPIESGVKGDIGEVRAGGDPFGPKQSIWVEGRQRIPDVLDSAKKGAVGGQERFEVGR